MVNIHHELELMSSKNTILAFETRSCPGGGLYKWIPWRHSGGSPAGSGMFSLARLVLQVHDELIFEVRESHLPQVAKIIQHCMEQAVVLGNVPLRVKMHRGTSWSDMQPYQCESCT